MMTYHDKMTNFQLNTAEYLARIGTPYNLGANYIPFQFVDSKNGFDCASAAMFCIENAVNHEVLTGNQNVILNEAKKKDGFLRFLKDIEKPSSGDLVLVNYPTGNKFDMGAYFYDGIYYPDPQDHVFTIGRNGMCIDTGVDDDKATVIKMADFKDSKYAYETIYRGKLTYLRVCYDNIKNKLL